MAVRSLILMAILGLVAETASAETIYYSESITGVTGNLNGTAIGLTSVVTITGSAESSTIIGPSNQQGSAGVYTVAAPLTIVVRNADGSLLATDTLKYTTTDDVGVFVSQTGLNGYGIGPTAGFYDNYNGAAGYVLATSDPSFATYTLGELTAPVTNTSLYNRGFVFKTAHGTGSLGFVLYHNDGDPFVASTFNAVPEPSSVAMTAIALLIGGGAQWRRQRNAKSKTVSAC